MPRAANAVDPGAARRPGAARALAVALLAATAFAAWVTARAFHPGSSSGGVLVVGVLVALGPWAKAAFAGLQLERGQIGTWRAVVWFVAACLALVFLMVAAGFSNMGG